MTWPERLSSLITELYDFAAAQSPDPLAASVEELSHAFNDLRRFRREDYFAQARARSAYLGYFAPKNIARMSFLLDLLHREGHLANLPQEPHVVDLGAGVCKTSNGGPKSATKKIHHQIHHCCGHVVLHHRGKLHHHGGGTSPPRGFQTRPLQQSTGLPPMYPPLR